MLDLHQTSILLAKIDKNHAHLTYYTVNKCSQSFVTGVKRAELLHQTTSNFDVMYCQREGFVGNKPQKYTYAIFKYIYIEKVLMQSKI